MKIIEGALILAYEKSDLPAASGLEFLNTLKRRIFRFNCGGKGRKNRWQPRFVLFREMITKVKLTSERPAFV